jgi:hypothetical protein
VKKSTRNWLIIGTIAAGGIVIWYVMRARSRAATTDPNVDPATGIPYAEEMGAYGGYGVGGGGSPSMFGYYDPSTGAYITGSGSPGGTVVTTPTTNAEWAQQVEAYLQQLGYDPITVAAALGKYLTGQTLSSDQSGIVAAAKGFYGNPPTPTPPIPPIIIDPLGQQTPKSYSRLSVGRTETLAQFAKEHKWSSRTLALVEALNQLKPTSKLRKGEKIIRPEWS